MTEELMDVNNNEKLIIEISTLGVVGYAFSKYDFLVVDSIRLINKSEESLDNVRVNAFFDFEYISSFSQVIERIEGGEIIEIEPELEISYRELFDLTETISDKIKVEVYSENGTILARKEKKIDLLPTNHWAGRIYPESIASFVMPNIPKITELVTRVSHILKENTGDGSIVGYQGNDKNRVRQQVAAIYSVLYEQNISYAEIPATFDTLGQRVRTPEEVLTSRLGNCIEMSVLFASLAEACGLNPLIISVKGHAFVGIWLLESFFDRNCTFEKSEIEKRIAEGINDIEVLEVTYLNGDSKKNFEQAVRKARGNLDELDFGYVVDIKRTHFFGIRPMPIKVINNGEVQLIDYGLAKDSEDKGVSVKTIEEYYLDTTVKTQVDKKEIWMRNMLDLTKRNSLISYKVNAKSIQIFNSNIAKLEDALADGEIFDIRERVNNWDIKLKKNSIIDIESYKEFIDKISQSEFKSKRIRTFLEKDELEKVLKSIYRETKLSVEEGGASSLFLAMGFLRWIDDKDPKDIYGNRQSRLAPLILVPVDLTRKSNNSYQISIRDEDAQMNITLLEFLRQRFNLVISGLSPLPEDESGVDVGLVLNSIRKRILNYKGWSVEELAVLGNFSFSQFVMWNDLNSRFDKLTENKVVNALVEGRYKEYSDKELKVSELDNVDVSKLAIPSSIDSSQLLSILEAAEGESFVLHGPPGTGKSQTITNMISNALSQKKSVLFVAEKMAALNVVYDRLSRLNLGDFCLELHSNKTQKRTVLEKLENNLSLHTKLDDNEYNRVANKIQQSKSKLNEIVNNLHKIRKNGFSVYDMILMYEQTDKVETPLDFTKEQLESFNKEKWEECLEAINYVIHTATNLTYPIANHPLKQFEKSGYELSKKEQLIKLLPVLEKSLEEVLDKIQLYRELYQIIENGEENLYLRLKHLENEYINNLNRELLNKVINKKTYQKVKLLILKFKVLEETRNNILERYSNDIENLELNMIKAAYLEANGKTFFKERKIKKSLLPLNSYTRNNFIVTKEIATNEIDSIVRFQENITECNLLFNEVIDLDINITQKDDLYELDELYNLLAENESYNIDKFISCLNIVKTTSLADFENIKTSYLELSKKLDELNLLVGFKKDINTEESIRNLLELIATWKENIDEWKSWTTFCQAIEDLKKHNLENISTYITEKMNDSSVEYGVKNLEQEYLRSLTKAFILYFTSEENSLNSFSGLTINRMIDEYNSLVSKYEKISEEQIRVNIQSNIPDMRNCSDEEAKQLSNVNRVIQSKGRGTSIRSLFKDNGGVIKRITPCMLMSPLSVAQYIDLDFPKFDLVIFDEASQIKTSMAIGAMSRAENCIIVGDPKQMPPTAFFASKKEDEDNLDVEDLESLLEDCLAVNMPQRFLNWHYRSQSESLIAFSNKMYYKNKMITFPSPSDTKSKVSLHYIKDGVYDRGNTRTNIKEAKAIVNEVKRRLKSEEERKNSIGVVTFNSTQQMLIDDLLQEEFSKNPELEKIANEMYESIFVKNLENVQGDERDVILFSITYGKDEDGKFYQNFGPLARKGGWRRLNVAVSRARKEMIIFSTIKAEEIKIAPRTQEGVVGLKNFMNFADKGIELLVDNKKENNETSNAIENSILEFLKNNGYNAKINVGVSDFNISIAVINPENNEKYLCAILLDNNQLKKLNTARDRYRLIPSVLERMGWDIYRIWSLDWYENKEKEQEKLLNYLNNLEKK